jgi:radical SAM superfamily enzyme YgiQ (UPF0313 family)
VNPFYAKDPCASFGKHVLTPSLALPGWGFLTSASLIATQGCTNRCDFCFLATGGQRIPYEMRPPEDVAAEFAETGAPYGVFIDNNLGASRPETGSSSTA